MLKITGTFRNETPEDIVLINEENHITRTGFLLCLLDLLTDLGLFAVLLAIHNHRRGGRG